MTCRMMQLNVGKYRSTSYMGHTRTVLCTQNRNLASTLFSKSESWEGGLSCVFWWRLGRCMSWAASRFASHSRWAASSARVSQHCAWPVFCVDCWGLFLVRVSLTHPFQLTHPLTPLTHSLNHSLSCSRHRGGSTRRKGQRRHLHGTLQ